VLCQGEALIEAQECTIHDQHYAISRFLETQVIFLKQLLDANALTNSAELIARN